jgi:membrane fusion protein (multidrug efflux system)
MIDHWGVEETDDAQLQAPITDIASRIPGTIAAVTVSDHQAVAPGQLLVLLDPRDAQARLQRAQADLQDAERHAQALSSQTGSSQRGADADRSLAEADALSAQAEYIRARSELQRLEFLLAQGGVSRQDVERARASFQQAQGQQRRSRATRERAQASTQQVGVDRQKAGAAAAKVLQARAALTEARLGLSYDRIVAPTAGRIGARTAEPGRQVLPGQPLMTLIGLHPWVEAHFKETQLQSLHPGQAADVRLDAFPGRVFRGRVMSLAPASGARFALLPPDNATGNFTKVVQRITARIELSGDEGGQPLPPALAQQLVPGLSASVRVRK